MIGAASLDTVQAEVFRVVDWQALSYWICTLANNQEELGADTTQSSFYLALQSKSCLATCLVLSE